MTDLKLEKVKESFEMHNEKVETKVLEFGDNLINMKLEIDENSDRKIS